MRKLNIEEKNQVCYKNENCELLSCEEFEETIFLGNISSAVCCYLKTQNLY